MSTIDLPLELKTAIVDHVDERADLLALALTCAAFNALCVRPLAWRELRMLSLDVPTLWRHIAGTPRDASLIRGLVIGRDEEDKKSWVPRLPAPFADAPEAWIRDEDDAEESGDEEGGGDAEPGGYARALITAFVQALAKMENLVALTIGGHAFPEGSVDAVWRTILASCGRLREVTLLPFIYEDDCLPEVICMSPLLFNLSNLVLFKSDFDSHLVEIEVTDRDLIRLLDACPLLHTLHLSFCSMTGPTDMDDVLGERTLPRLVSLALGSTACTPNVFAAFLLRHPLLHTLDLKHCKAADMPPPVPADLGVGSLPGLRILALPESGAHWITATYKAGAPLEEIRGFSFQDAAHWGAPGVEDALVRLKGTLKRIVLVRGSGGHHDGSKGLTKKWFERALPEVKVVFIS